MYLITGASRGIGKYLFEYFKQNGFAVFGTYNNSKVENSPEIEHVDIKSFDQVNDWVLSKVNSLKPEKLHLINCAGISYNSVGHKADAKKWEEVIQVNLLGTFNTIRASLPYMREINYGRIINFSSVVAQKGVIGTSAYSASKAGLWGLTKTIALENASKGITVNNINLGYFNIGMIDQVPAELLANIVKQIPVGKLGDPGNIIRTVEYLIDNSDITGTSIDMNGGLY